MSDAKRARETVEKYRERLRTEHGVCVFTETGPVGMTVVDALLSAIESIDARLTAIEETRATVPAQGQLKWVLGGQDDTERGAGNRIQ